MTTKTRLDTIPREICDQIISNLDRVNDQICLALTSKHFFTSITTNKNLSCNSPKDSVRYEAWRFNWMMGDSLPENLPRFFDNDDVKALSLDEQAVVRQHLRRCKKSSKADLWGRLASPRKRCMTGPKVSVSRYGERRPSTRRASIEAAERIRKMARK